MIHFSKNLISKSMIILSILSSSVLSAATNKDMLETATFASGCFWCTEAIFQQLEGVESVRSGYTDGHIKNPTYREVCDETTGHAEAVEIKFDPEIISFTKLMEVFFMTHNPTTLNRQGADVGTQYRSAIFYHSDIQKQEAELTIQKLNESGAWDDAIVTELSKACYLDKWF